jgi:hypothetical protein
VRPCVLKSILILPDLENDTLTCMRLNLPIITGLLRTGISMSARCGLWSRSPLTAVLAIAVSVIPVLLESRDPLGPYAYRRLLNHR